MLTTYGPSAPRVGAGEKVVPRRRPRFRAVKEVLDVRSFFVLVVCWIVSGLCPFTADLSVEAFNAAEDSSCKLFHGLSAVVIEVDGFHP